MDFGGASRAPRAAGRTVSGDAGSEIRFEAVYVEAQNGRGNQFAHACPACAERLKREGDRSSKRCQVVKRGPVAPFVGERISRCRLSKRPLVRVGNQQEGLF